MGNNVTKTIDKWGLNPRKFTLKRAKERKGPPMVPDHQAPVYYPHLYDSETAEPQYAQVNKRRKQDTDDLHYADIQVLQPKSLTSRREQTMNNHSTTQYATIDFKTPVSPHTPDEPADLFIPPGVLKRPNMRPSRK
ncbi:uncharacterized protein zgc:193711 [Triplophysa dalaica]|uniref:uncharacterized protein zgc:193711 n=1 Tax=Triplophysa dalaica TaxID=1582913 RepID=UPI0024DFE8D7|nr:uncharacterized protein zgc:193711 [Triplophysa dalaica]